MASHGNPRPNDRWIRVIDSHTEGEPTRVILSGGPDLGSGSFASRVERFRNHHDDFRRLIVDEPRGSPIAVGALLCAPVAPVASGVVFFNNTGYLGMCGHGTIGVLVTLHHLGRISAPGTYRLETPVGVVSADLHSAHEVTFTNVASYRHRKDVDLEVPGYGRVRGDIAWGGNWFFLVTDSTTELRLADVPALTDRTVAIRQELRRKGITGADGAEIDHIELSGPPQRPDADGRNFVLCPGGAYDRSPCGTGTSAKMACLHADGELAEGALWRQESVLGTRFVGRLLRRDGILYPTIRGSAYVTGETELLVDQDDPLIRNPQG
ncbi:MAG: hydroxyproline-2-epimerase [Thermoplasmata archaeon]|nr:hydroxyproline-2-epimerase [Thermoplasmata archaeon]